MMGKRLTGDFRRDLDKPFLGHWDIPEGRDLVLTIDHMEKQEVKSQRGTEQKTVMIFKEETVKPMILNVVNRKSIAKALGSSKYEDWEGRKIALFEGREPKSEDGLAIRIRDYPPKVTELICADCGDLIEDTEIGGKVYKARVIAERAMTKYGKHLCYVCAKMREENDAISARSV